MWSSALGHRPREQLKTSLIFHFKDELVARHQKRVGYMLNIEDEEQSDPEDDPDMLE